MAINTTNIIGDIFLPDGTVIDKSFIIFRMTGYDTDADSDAVIVPKDIRAPIDALGAIDVDLWPNPDGVRSTFYKVAAELYNGVNPALIDLGKISVPATGGPFDINDLLPIAPPSGATVADYIVFLASAVATAEVAADNAAADAAQTALDRVATAADVVSADASRVAAVAAAATLSAVAYATKTAMNAVTGSTGDRAYVYADTTTANNGLYFWTGSAWAKDALDFQERIAASEYITAIERDPKTVTTLVYPTTFTSSVFAGADFNTADRLDGFTIPIGSTGFQTFDSAITQIGYSKARALSGKTARFIFELETSVNGLAQRGFGVIKSVGRVTGTTDPLGTFSNFKLVQLTPTRAIVVSDFTFGGVEENVSLGIQQVTNNTGTNAEVSIKPLSISYAIVDVGAYSKSVKDNSPSGVEYIRMVTVKPDGTGDYTTLATAIAAQGGGTSHWQRVLYQVYAGIYTDIQYSIPQFCDVRAKGRLGEVWLKGYQAEDATIADITLNSTIQMDFTSRLFGLKITAQNMRYCIHADAPTNSGQDPRAKMEIVDCYVDHLGNQEAIDYQTSLGGAGNPGGVFSAPQAFGCGTHSDNHITSKRTTWVGGRFAGSSAFGFHTNKDFAYPSRVELIGGAVINPTGGNAIGTNAYGSGVQDSLTIDGTQIDGTIVAKSGSWLSADLKNTPSDRTSEIIIDIRGTGAAWTSDNTANALELRSVDASNSAVLVSGTGADALFGSNPIYRLGGIGYPARVYSRHAINGVVGTALGLRLGDCTGTSKTLTVAFEGGAPVDLTLSEDYTANSNAVVISKIVALLTGAGITGKTVLEVNAFDNEAPVYQRDYEIELTNTSATTVIRKGMAVAYDGSKYLGRIATSADARTVLAGIALENIAPGQIGRVQKSGHIASAQVLFSAAPSIAFGDSFGVSASAGQIVEGAGIELLRAVTGDVLEIV
jgi:hypothetical protein